MSALLVYSTELRSASAAGAFRGFLDVDHPKNPLALCFGILVALPFGKLGLGQGSGNRAGNGLENHVLLI